MRFCTALHIFFSGTQNRVSRANSFEKWSKNNYLLNRAKMSPTTSGYPVISPNWTFCGPGHQSSHRGLKLDGAIGQGEICNSLKSEIFSKSFLSHIGKNKIKI